MGLFKGYQLFLFIGLWLLLKPLGLRAQQTFTLKGIIVTSQTNARQANVEIKNLSSHAVRLSDEHGMFTIPAQQGDTLQFSKSDFTVQKQAVTSNNDMVVYLQPTINLNTVTVKGQSIKQEQQQAIDAYRSKGVYNGGKTSVLAAVASPINALYDAFGKEPKRARRFANYVKEENESIKINQRFSKSMVRQITNLPDDELALFMDTYRPRYDDLVKWNDYDLINYIKKSFASYTELKKRPATLPKLSNP